MVIDEHFCNELLQDRKVKCNQNIYRSLFNKIWPSSANFINFLMSSSIDLKINYAIKVYENLALINDFFLPPFTILSVLNQQAKEQQDSNKNYIPQDHVIHSVNLYILGVYIFFNSDKVSNKILLDSHCNDHYAVIKKFILKWQLFSFYHDIGYSFEKTYIDENLLKNYESLYASIVHFLTVKNISKFLTYKILFEKSPKVFKFDEVNNIISCWYNLNDTKIEQEYLKQDIHKFDGAKIIRGISNDEEFLPLLTLLKDKEYLVVVYNEYGDIVSLVVRQGLKIIKNYSRSPELKNKLFINNYINSTNQYYRYQYCVNDIDNSCWEAAFDKNVLELNKEFFETLSKQIKNYISINSEDVENILYNINNWVNNTFPLNDIKEVDAYQKQKSSCCKKSLISIFCREFEERLNKQEITQEKMCNFEWIKEFVSEICNEQLSKKIDKDFLEKYDEVYGSPHDYVQFFKDAQHRILKQSFVDEDKKSLNIYDKKNFRLTPFKHNNSNEIHNKLYEFIKQCAFKLNISLEELENYKPIFEEGEPIFSDHGVASASLLYQAAVFILDVKKYCNDRFLSFAWDDSSNNDMMSYCAESIFAILLHNIYNKKSKPKYGVDYYQNFDLDSFSYFCTFCDNIQRWGRPKQLDYSKTTIPPINYLEDEFDIYIANDTIFIKCKDKYINHFNSVIEEAESFLPGIRELIKTEQFIV